MNPELQKFQDMATALEQQRNEQATKNVYLIAELIAARREIEALKAKLSEDKPTNGEAQP